MAGREGIGDAKGPPSESIPARRKVAVTGANGMLGSRIVEELVRKGYSDILLIVRNASKLRHIPEGTTVAELSLMNPVALKEALQSVDTVFHTAAKVSFAEEEDMVGGNAEITSNVVDAALECGVRLLVHTSSIAALSGMNGSRSMIDEKARLDSVAGLSAYSQSKFYSENQIRRGEIEGLKAIIVNPAVILGAGEWRGSGSSALIPAVSCGLPFYTLGVTGYVDVCDCARAMVALAECEAAQGESFILCGANLSFREFITMAAKAAGRKAPCINVGKRIIKACSVVEKFLLIFAPGRRPVITPMAISSLLTQCRYDGSKVSKYTGFEYTPVEESIGRVVKEYLEWKGSQ